MNGNISGSLDRQSSSSLQASAKLLTAKIWMGSSEVQFILDYITVVIRAKSCRTDLNHGALHHSADVISPFRHTWVQLIQVRRKCQNMWAEIIWNPQSNVVHISFVQLSLQQSALALTVRQPVQIQCCVSNRNYGGLQSDWWTERDEEAWGHWIKGMHCCSLYLLFCQLLHQY